MARRVALINMKGGVGKTTLTVQLAYWFTERRHKRVLVVDLDPQFNATQYLLGPHQAKTLFDSNAPTIWHVFEAGDPRPQGTLAIDKPTDALVPIIKKQSWTGSLHLLPSQLELAYSLMEPKGKERRLAKFLDKIDSEFDLILLDCAPTLSILTLAAYHAAEKIIVPVKPEYLSTIGLSLLVKSFTESTKGLSRKPVLAGIVYTATEDYAPEEIIAKREVESLAKENQWRVFKEAMPFSRSFSKGPRLLTPIHRTPYARGRMKDRFSELCREFSSAVELER